MTEMLGAALPIRLGRLISGGSHGRVRWSFDRRPGTPAAFSTFLRRRCAGLIVAALAAGALSAQQVHIVPRVPPPNAPSVPGAAAPATPTLTPRPKADVNMKVNVNLVLVPVTITDPMDRLVTGLDAGQFRIFEDKIPQAIKTFSTEDAPISVGIIFDSSGSMSDKIRKSREALQAFFKTANPQDEFFMIDFADEPHLLADFTTNVDQLENGVAFVPARGRTALLDAIYLGLDKMRNAHNSRKALLIISDGGDNHSRYTEAEIRNVVRESDVQIFSIGIFSPAGGRDSPEERAGPSLLGDISEATGGRMFAISDVDELPDVATKIGEELRNEYVLGYTPSNPQHDGKWRKIRVKLSPPPGLPPLTVYAKVGYYAPAR